MRKSKSFIMITAAAITMAVTLPTTAMAATYQPVSAFTQLLDDKVADTSMYRGVVSNLYQEEGITTFTLKQAVGTNFGSTSMRVEVDKDTKLNCSLEDIKEGAYVEVYYGVPADNMMKTEKAILVNTLIDVNMSNFNGEVVSITKDKANQSKGSILLKMVDTDNTIVFHYDEETKIYMDMDKVKAGDKLNIYYNGITTRSVPAQGNAMEIRSYADNTVYRGNVSSITTKKGITTLILKRYAGTPFSDTFKVSLGKNTKYNVYMSKIKKGDYVEVFYSPAKSPTAITIEKLMEASILNFNGTLVEVQPDTQKDGTGVLLMKGSTDNQEILFHYSSDTVFKKDLTLLKKGDKLSIYHRGAVTLSLPPQGSSLEVSAYKK